MAGLLSFTLGLETQQFVSALGLSSGKVLSFAGAMDALRRIAGETWAAIERGGALYDLSHRTGETVSNLYRLQEAFKVTGLGADSVAPMILRLQRALSGVDELGQKTDGVFDALGLNMETLTKIDAPAQFEAIAKAMASLPKEQMAGFAQRIFGREGSGNFLQLARDHKEFAATLRDAGPEANIVARTAAAFDAIGDVFSRIGSKFGAMFTGIAEAVAPVLQQVFDFINGIDFVGIGQKLGHAFSFALEVFKSGKFFELLGAGFEAYFEAWAGTLYGTLANPAFWGSLWSIAVGSLEAGLAGALKVILNLGVALKASFIEACQILYEWLGSIPKVGEWLGVAGSKHESFKTVYARERANAADANRMVDEWIGSGAGTLSGGVAALRASITAALTNASGPAFEHLKQIVMDIDALIPPAAPFKEERVPGAALDIVRAGKNKPGELTDWEKMGFMLNSAFAGPGFDDSARRTADNTSRTVNKLERISEQLAGLAPDYKRKA